MQNIELHANIVEHFISQNDDPLLWLVVQIVLQDVVWVKDDFIFWFELFFQVRFIVEI